MINKEILSMTKNFESIIRIAISPFGGGRENIIRIKDKKQNTPLYPAVSIVAFGTFPKREKKRNNFLWGTFDSQNLIFVMY